MTNAKRVLFLHVVLVFWLSHVGIATAWGHGFSIPQAGTFYVGAWESNGHTVTVELTLEAHHVFVLRQTSNSLPTYETAGNWRQIHNGALLQLSNSYGLWKNINIGSEESLYLDEHLRDGTIVTIEMKKEKNDAPICRPIAGFFNSEKNTFYDVFTSRNFSFSQPLELVTYERLFLRGRGCSASSSSNHELPVIYVEYMEEKTAPHLWDRSENDFSERVAERIWKVSNGSTCWQVFFQKINNQWMATFSGPGFQQQYPCTIGAGNISMEIGIVSSAHPLPPELGFAQLSFFEWHMEGDVLILSSEGRELAVLEKN